MHAAPLDCVLVAGSLPRGLSDEHQKEFEKTCHELGAAIARRGSALLIGSLEPQTADPHALAGYLENGGQRPILMRLKRRGGDETQPQWRRLTERLQGATTELVPDSAGDGLWRLRAVRRADGVVLIGGQGGTSMLHRLCMVRAKCFTGMHGFPGPGAEAFTAAERLLGQPGMAPLLVKLSQASAEPALAIELLASMAHERVRLFPPRLQREEAESHASRALGMAQLAQGSRSITGAVLLRHILAVMEGGQAFGVLRNLLSDLHLTGGNLQPATAPEIPSSVTLEPGLMETLRIARAAVPARDRIWGRTLVAAVLFDPKFGEDPVYGHAAAKLRERWRAFVVAGSDHANVPTWLDALEELESRLPSTATASAPTLATSSSTGVPQHEIDDIAVAAPGNDDPWNVDLRDQLKVGAEARAFARIAAATLFKPPLAVGVFGDWGSGKSFFMRLVHEHVERLANGTRHADAPEAGDQLFHTGIVQIRFNAWHYAETNLWASLVDHLFTELDRWLRRTDAKGAEPLLERLSTARELTLSAAEDLIRQRKEQREAVTRLEGAELALERARDAAGRSPGAWLAALKAAVEGDPALEQLETQFREEAQKLGLYDANREAESLAAAARAMDSELTRADVLRRSVLARLHGPWLAVLLILSCLVAPLALGIALNLLTQIYPSLRGLHEGVLQMGTIFATAGGIIATIAQQARGALARLERARDGLDEAVRKQVESPQGVLKDAKERVQRLTAEAEEARARLSSSTDRLAEATRDYATGSGSGRLREFIRARATDGQYARHLGLIATIRRDFEELATNLQGTPVRAREELTRSLDAFRMRVYVSIQENPKILRPDEARKLKESATPPPQSSAFQRIVLYIDDLDRCSPSKVIEVLEALHLLLTFPLFVVFVAVDVRWVSRSLERRYRGLLQPEQQTTPSGPAATALDYLEKIFQVPYWVRPMSSTASKDFMLARTTADVAEDEDTGVQLTRVAEVPAPDATVMPADAVSPSASGAEPKPASEGAEPLPTALTPGDPLRVPTPDPPGLVSVEVPPTDARALRLTEDERACLALFAPFVGASPRRSLRFLNTYRVIKASMSKDDLDKLHAGGYRALLAQLAIATGAPSLLGQWLGTLSSGAELPSLRGSVSTDYEDGPERVRLEGALAAYAATPDVALLGSYAQMARRYSFPG